MLLIDFLKAVVPTGLVIVARQVDAVRADGTPFKTFSHTVCDDHEQAASVAAAMSADGFNTYFALASYKQGFHTNAKGKRVVRVRENVDQLQALWLDIDFKGAYPDAVTAMGAVAKFAKTIGLPVPSFIVGSGNGVHVYWPLTEAIPLARWQGLAEAFKEAAKAHGLGADLVCTADACRVLRPPGTLNLKDPTNPKPVKLLFANPGGSTPEALEAILTAYQPTGSASHLPTAPAFMKGAGNEALGGGLAERSPVEKANFGTIQKHCGVSRLIVETRGKDLSEPEWVGILQLLKHCEDGADWVQTVSDGHPGYTAAATDMKWEARIANSAGPTLCKSFEVYNSKICAKCPHNGFIKSPTQVGHEGTTDVGALPYGWRIAADASGVERLMLTDPTNNVREWVKMFRHVPSNFRPVRSIITGQYEMMLDVKLRGAEAWTVTMPMSMLGNSRKLVEHLASFGVVLKSKEIPPFGDLMASWLEKLQSAKRVADVSEQLGWMTEGEKLVGFACSPTAYYNDGRIRNDVRPSREFASLAKLYEPRGELDEWKKVAKFLADQNSPALCAVLAASFGAPLLKFVGIQGGILSLVSAASGVGKTSVLKASQAVWGSPTQAVNSVDDTPKSVAKKMGFLNNLPAFWDELRGKQTVDGFTSLAFQITQGKEKSRLDSGANLRDSQTWETMLVVASNESIFDAMARRTQGSDAGMVRTFEIVMDEAPKALLDSSEVTLLFERLATNYGHAGRAYAQYLALHTDEVRKMVQDTFRLLAKDMEAQERFWYGIVAILLVGAALASKLGLVDIDRKTLRGFLLENLESLKLRTRGVAESNGMNELLSEYLRERGDRVLVIDKFYVEAGLNGRPPAEYTPEVLSTPRSERCAIVVARESKQLRFSIRDYQQFLLERDLKAYGAAEDLVKEMGAKKLRCVLGLGTKYATPRIYAIEMSTTWAGSESPAQSPGS